MVKLSLVIPHWNCFDLLEKLLKELSIQVNNEIEIIVVDDSNETRLNQFEQMATVIHNNERGGLSKARNIGMKLSKGEYIGFIDADDMITNDYVETLLKTINEHNEDIIIFNWADFNENVIIRHPKNYAVWKAIYKKEICPYFNEDMWYNEDVFFQEELSKKECNKYYIDRVLYIYNSNRIGSNMWEKLHKGK